MTVVEAIDALAKSDGGAALAAGAAAAVATLLVAALLRRLGTRREPQSASTSPAVSAQLAELSGRLSALGEAAERGRAENHRLVEARLDALADRLGGGLSGAAEKTARSLGEIGERLEAIDKAQAAIERLSGDMLGLQDILSNKQSRGLFGELQLSDLLKDALPADKVVLQATLGNGRRVDALIKLPHPPGPVAVDAKFPLESYEALRAAGAARDAEAVHRAERRLKQAVRTHIAAIAERYMSPGETADGALMFVPSEAVYAEIHARCPDVVRDGFARRVWLVSPTTLMATLMTMRAALRDIEIQTQAGDLRREIRMLAADVERLRDRAEKLRAHFGQAEGDVRDVLTSVEKIVSRARRLSGREAVPAEEGS